MPKLYFQRQFSTSKTNGIFFNFFSLKNIDLGKHFLLKKIYFLKFYPIFVNLAFRSIHKIRQLHEICSSWALTLADFDLNNLIDTLQILAEIEANPSSLKYLGLQLTCSPGFSNLPTASQPISPENDGKWISQKTACIYQLSISLMLFL